MAHFVPQSPVLIHSEGGVRVNPLEPGRGVQSPPVMHNPFRYFNGSPEVIRLAVTMYFRYPLSLRQVEDLLFERAPVSATKPCVFGGIGLVRC